MAKIKAAIIGSGNIGTDLLYKLLRSEFVEPVYMIGVDPESEGLRRAKGLGLEVSSEGVEWLLRQDSLPDIVFEATSAKAHVFNAPLYREAGIRAVDLTPAAVGPAVIPPVNLTEHIDEMNVNMITCGGQATIPMVHAVGRVVNVDYAEVVATIASLSAGPGTRANIDEFTETTSRGIEVLGGAQHGKAIIILNPADPPIMMRDTVFARLPADTDVGEVEASIRKMEAEVQSYVPGYHLKTDPQFYSDHVAIFIEVQGAGDFLPPYAGNLDIMTSAATKVGDEIAKSLMKELV